MTRIGTTETASNLGCSVHTVFVAVGFDKETASHCSFLDEGRDIRLAVHGDDNFVAADAEQLT